MSEFHTSYKVIPFDAQLRGTTSLNVERIPSFSIIFSRQKGKYHALADVTGTVSNIDQRSDKTLSNQGVVVKALNAVIRGTDQEGGTDISVIRRGEASDWGRNKPIGITFHNPDQLITYPPQLRDMSRIGPDSAIALHDLATAATGRIIFDPEI
ncbi:MAG TPA: hypothetical protein VLF93_04550 [Candidatus Saccharimonadales bacterium]|nr:hypothetical protein [Candidatus Saccharimonadales bacterium]